MAEGGGARARLGRLRSRLGQWYAKNALQIKLGALVGLLVIIYLMPLIYVPIYPGESGVLWRRFFGGTATDLVLGEGVNLKFPWDEVYVYDVRMQTETTTFNVLAEDGLNMDVEVTVRFRLNPRYLGLLHKNIGPDYVQKLVIPEVAAHGREAMAQLRPDELYTHRRQKVQDQILEKLARTLDVAYLPGVGEESFIYVQDLLIRNIVLPPPVADAIHQKVVQKQRLQEYEYRLQKEEKEKQRKRIEGEGIQLFQSMVTEGISDEFLKWKGINATLELARSNNSKIVIIGGGKEGLPIILGPLDSQAAAPPAAAPPRSLDEAEIPRAADEVAEPEPDWGVDKP